MVKSNKEMREGKRKKTKKKLPFFLMFYFLIHLLIQGKQRLGFFGSSVFYF